MNIRPMKFSDKALVNTEAMHLATKFYPELAPDREKTNRVLATVLTDTSHYARVIDVDGDTHGALIALTSPNFWAQRQHCGVVLWYSYVPGGGVALLRDFKDWVIPQRKIRAAGFTFDINVDPRVLKLVERYGFEVRGGARILFN